MGGIEAGLRQRLRWLRAFQARCGSTAGVDTQRPSPSSGTGTWPVLPPLPFALTPAGPTGLSGPCELWLLDGSQLQGCLSAFHDGDLALDLVLPGQRRPLCVPLGRLQYLHLDTLPEIEGTLGQLQGPRVAVHGPASEPLLAECLGERTVSCGHWLLLRTAPGRVGQWFLPRHRAVTLRCLESGPLPGTALS